MKMFTLGSVSTDLLVITMASVMIANANAIVQHSVGMDP